MGIFSLIMKENHIREANEKVTEALELALEECGAEAERYAKMKCPTDTGLLKNSITYAVHGKTPNIETYTAKKKKKGEDEVRSGQYNGAVPDDELAVYIGTNVEYGPYVEMGSSRRKDAKPFIRPALENHIDKYQRIIKKHLENA